MVLFLINLYFVAVIFLRLKKELKSKIISNSLLFFNNKQVFNSSLVVFFYIFFFLIFFRFLRVLNNQKKYLDLTGLDFTLFYYVDFNLIIILVIILLILNLAKKYVFSIIRFHYLRIHYYFFLRFVLYQNCLFFIQNIFFFLSLKTKISKIYLFFLFKYIPTLLIVMYLLFILFFQQKTFYIGWLPWYSIYIFFISLVEFSQRFKEDFDAGILQLYYPKRFGVTKFGLDKLRLYQIMLVLGENILNFDFYFEDSLLIFLNDENLSNKKILFFNYSSNFLLHDEVNILKIHVKDKKPEYISVFLNNYFNIKNIHKNEYININNHHYSFI